MRPLIGSYPQGTPTGTSSGKLIFRAKGRLRRHDLEHAGRLQHLSRDAAAGSRRAAAGLLVPSWRPGPGCHFRQVQAALHPQRRRRALAAP
jgi:hypothetical protein